MYHVTVFPSGRVRRDHGLILDCSAAERRKAYRELFRAKLPVQFVDDLRAATNAGWALGDDRFKRQIAKMAGRRATQPPKRPLTRHADRQAATDPNFPNKKFL